MNNIFIVLILNGILISGSLAGVSKQCERATNDATRVAYAYAEGRVSYQKLQTSDKKTKKICKRKKG